MEDEENEVGQILERIEILEGLNRNDPDDWTTLEELAEQYEAIGNTNGAHKAKIEIQRTLIRLGENEKAVKNLEKNRKEFPEEEEARVLLEEIQAAKNNEIKKIEEEARRLEKEERLRREEEKKKIEEAKQIERERLKEEENWLKEEERLRREEEKTEREIEEKKLIEEERIKREEREKRRMAEEKRISDEKKAIEGAEKRRIDEKLRS